MALNKRILQFGELITGDPVAVDYLVIAGGGGTWDATGGGGGGAGGLRTSYGSTSGGGGSAESQITLNPGVTYTITVGAAGTASTSNTNGGDSSISGSDITDIVSDGGGKGGPRGTTGNGFAGGSGGGAAASTAGFSVVDNNSGGAGTTNQGFRGGNTYKPQYSILFPHYGGGGGGGAASVGDNHFYDTSQATLWNGADGGDSLANSITGSSVYYAGGAFGRKGNQNNWNGSSYTPPLEGEWDPNFTPAPNSGGGNYSGVVIIRIPTANYSGNVTGSPTVTTDGTDTILKFTGSGTYRH